MLLKSAGYWLILSMAFCAEVLAGQQPPPPASRQAPDQKTPSSGATAPNDDFIEFLGADDVGDAAWWEFLNKSAPRKAKPPVPPQDAKQ